MKSTTASKAFLRRMLALTWATKTRDAVEGRYQRFQAHLAQHRFLSLALGDEEQAEASEDGLSLPPPVLREWVAGTTDAEWFLESGKRGEQAILSILGKHGIEFGSLNSVLDFGCGCGRVIRHLRRYTSVQLHGSDINRAAIAWCDRNLKYAKFGTNRLAPPSRYRPHSFDLILLFSVFTHLTQRLQKAWMREMRRILKPQGYLIISVHGDHYLPHLPAAQQAEYRQGRLVVIGGGKAGLNACGAFHPERYVRDVLAKEADFKVIDFFPQGALGNPLQDAYLLQS
jgi:SAM-dependent methyltransferase